MCGECCAELNAAAKAVILSWHAPVRPVEPECARRCRPTCTRSHCGIALFFLFLPPPQTPPTHTHKGNQRRRSSDDPFVHVGAPSRRNQAICLTGQVSPLSAGAHQTYLRHVRGRASPPRTNRPLCAAGCDLFPSADTRFLLSRGSCAASGGRRHNGTFVLRGGGGGGGRGRLV